MLKLKTSRKVAKQIKGFLGVGLCALTPFLGMRPIGLGVVALEKGRAKLTGDLRLEISEIRVGHPLLRVPGRPEGAVPPRNTPNESQNV